jgi:plasmid stabilization system protein ParE
VRGFWIEPDAQREFEEGAAWYEGAREGLGLEFIGEVERTLARIAHHPEFATAAVATVAGGIVRQEFVRRFPYVVYFVETGTSRRVISIRRANSDPHRWRSRA